MRNSRTSWLCLAVLVTIVLLPGCSNSAPAAKGDADRFTVGFIYIGSKQDYGYNQAHALGAAAVNQHHDANEQTGPTQIGRKFRREIVGRGLGFWLAVPFVQQ